LLWRCDSTRVMASSFLRFLDHTQRRTTVGKIPLDEWSARRRDLYLTTHNNHNRQIFMPPVGFEHTISAGYRPQTYDLDRAAIGTGNLHFVLYDNPLKTTIILNNRPLTPGGKPIAVNKYHIITKRFSSYRTVNTLRLLCTKLLC
jgi:hypothetical protein